VKQKTPSAWAHLKVTLRWLQLREKIAPLIENGLKTDCGIEML
jgi:hypothetical protein